MSRFYATDAPTGRGLLNVRALPIDRHEQWALDELRRRRESREREKRHAG